MTAASDYGSTLTFGGVAVFKCIVTDFPEILTAALKTTNHSSGGHGEKIPSGVVDLGDIALSVLNESGTLAAINTYIENKTVNAVVLTNGVNTLTCQGFFLSAKLEAADAQDPKPQTLAVSMALTGQMTVV